MAKKLEVPAHTSKQEYAYEIIKQKILTSELKPNTLLVERTLSEILHISRTPIRAALTQLSKEGLVNFYPGRGMLVTPFNKKEAEDAYTLREVLDVLAITLFMQNGSRASHLEMEDIVTKMEMALQVEDFKLLSQHDIRFHEIYSSNTGNRQLEVMLKMLMDQVIRLLHNAQTDYDRVCQSVKEHRAIVDGIIKGDQKSGQDEMYHHIVSLKYYHLKRLDELQQQIEEISPEFDLFSRDTWGTSINTDVNENAIITDFQKIMTNRGDIR